MKELIKTEEARGVVRKRENRKRENKKRGSSEVFIERERKE